MYVGGSIAIGDIAARDDIDVDQLYNPSKRDFMYGDGEGLDVAQYLIDLHDTRGTFNFCGGMLFQLVLSEKLRAYLGEVASVAKQRKLKVSSANVPRMFMMDGYEQSAKADNIQIFHGREVRNVPGAAGGRGFVLHLSMADGNDPEGWTDGELDDYNGWEHDVNRRWRNGDNLAEEGFSSYKEKFGPKAFGLHHRFYLHFDNANQIWLSAEDGCEGTPAMERNGIGKFFGF